MAKAGLKIWLSVLLLTVPRVLGGGAGGGASRNATRASAEGHYGNPLSSVCRGDEQSVLGEDLGITGGVCAPIATGILSNACPTDTPAGCTITPKAILTEDTQPFDKLCALECASLPIPDQELADAACGGSGMSCKKIPTYGKAICFYG